MKLDDVKSTEMYIGKKPVSMQNIPTNSLTVVDKHTDSKYCHVRLFKSGIIQLTGFAIAQFLEGAELVVADSIITMMKVDNVKLILRLSKSISMVQAMESANIEVNYEDLKTLRNWLELRMAHCEQERDQRTMINRGGHDYPKFNPDTYIGMKLLLLDIRELMLGEIVIEN